MQTKTFLLSLGFVSLHSIAACQVWSNCNEKSNSPQKLFVFIGELLQANTIQVKENYEVARFSATYKIIERICGKYLGNTISVDVIQGFYDSSFKKSRYQLLMLTKDTSENDKYVLWRNLYYNVFKTAKNQWFGTYMPKYEFVFANQKALKPKKIKFPKTAFYETRGMTREEIDLTYPEPFYKIKKDRVIPLWGNSIAELFQHEKEGTLANADIYEQSGMPLDTNGQIAVNELVVENINQEDPDSFNRRIEKDYLAVKDSLAKDPFREKTIDLLFDICRAQKNYSKAREFFKNLLEDYPDSIKAFLLEAKFMHRRASLEDSTRIFVLREALKININNYEVIYDLAISYYRLFLQKPNRYFASTAQKWFIRCIESDTAQAPWLSYPVMQLSNYLNDVSTLKQYQELCLQVSTDARVVPGANKQHWYFPIESFARDNTAWLSDNTIDIIQKLKPVKSELDWFSDELASFEEPKLYGGYKGKAYRFLWLRSFDAPIVIRLEKTKRQVRILWKVGRFDDSLNTHQPGEEFKKNLSTWQWKKFERLLTTIDYWSMTSNDYSNASTDGATWVLEATIKGRYKVTERSGYTYLKYTKCLRYLIELTDLNLPEERIY